MKRTITVITMCLLAAGAVQATLLSDIDADAGVADYSGQTFTGPQPFTTNLHNWGRNDNFTGANFGGLTIGIGDGGHNANQPFLSATIANANFSGVTFNYGPFVHSTSGLLRINMFHQESITGTKYSGATFADSVWNITLNSTTIDAAYADDFFDDGSGATTAATAANAVDFSGATFNFTGVGVGSIDDDIVATLIDNLGGFDGTTAIGAKYDDDFLANNYAAFGYVDEAALETALDTAGWQWSDGTFIYALISASPLDGSKPLEVVFDGSGSSSSTNIVSYEWSFGDGNTNSGVLATNTYTADGSYTAWLTVTDGAGQIASNSVVITVEPLVYDIGTDTTVTFDSAVKMLTNAAAISDWVDSGMLKINDGSNLSNVDFTALGITSWATDKFSTGGSASPTTTWDGANLSGLNLTFSGSHNFGYNDTFVGTDFSGATIANGGYNQCFLFSDLTGADFSGATLNITPWNGNINTFRGATLTSADFSDVTWGVAVANATTDFFSGGAGTTSVADKDLAVTFFGADLSQITDVAQSTMIANLGDFDSAQTNVAIGAKYDAAMLAASGWSQSELDAAGWQYVITVLPATLTVGVDGSNIVIGASGMGLGAVNSLQESDGLVFTNWVTIATTTGVENVEWTIPATNEPAAFFRVISE